MIVKFFKKYYLLVSAILVTILFAGYYQQTYSTNYASSVAAFTDSFHALEERLDNALRYKSGEIIEKGIDEQWINVPESEDISIHVYRNDSLIFWNTNQLPIIRFAEIHFPAEGLLHLQNGWYYTRTREADNYLICGTFLIKHDYSYENKDLHNRFSDKLALPISAQITVDQESGYPIHSQDDEYIFSLLPDDDQSADESESITLMFLLLVCIILWLYWLTKMKATIAFNWGWTIPVAVVVFRIASIKYVWLGFLHGTTAFEPSLYGTNQWFPNFFEYLVNIAVAVYLLHEIKSGLKQLKVHEKNRMMGAVLGVTLLLLSIVLWPILLDLIKGLIENSSIPLIIDKLFSLNVFSFLAVMSVGVFFYAYFHFVRGIVGFCKKSELTGSQLSVLCFAISCAYFFYEINVGNQLIFTALFPLILYGNCIYLVFRTRRDQQFGSGLILLSVFSVVLALTIGEFDRKKEQGERELYANQLATEKNIVTEVEYSALASKLKFDNFLKRFISSPRFISVSDFQENLERRFFKGFWERYEMKFSLFSSEHRPLIDKRKNNTELYDELQDIIDRSGVLSEIDSNIYFISDYTGKYSYIIRQEIVGKDGDIGILFCTLKSKKIPEEIGFPRLLISDQANVLESLETYSIAKYLGTRLVTKYGSFNYPSSYLKMKPKTLKRKGFFDYGGFNHYLLKKSANDAIVLSIKNVTRMDLLTSFSYLFSFYGLLLLPLLFRMNATHAFKRTLSLAMKIQIVLISLVFLSLLAFGWGSGVFVSSQYNQYTDDVIREKLNSVETEVKAKLGEFDELSIVENGSAMQYYLQKFSRVFFTDINLYDSDGYLLATSRPKVFNIGLLSEQMNPTAYQNLKYGQKSEFVHLESIGELNYSSAYQPFYNNAGKELAYINLQHFGQQSEFENQIQKFLVAIINVFIFLLAVSIILAIFISNWLTAPLRILQESFAEVKFGTHNERISYDKDDEIGSLVRDYNQKLEELEFTASQLAQSERESAWREMAKQVAHEIKNPLTPMKLSVQQLLRTFNPEDPKSEIKLQKVANSIIEQIDALTRIANEFALFAKMPNPREEKLELVALIRGVKEVFTLEGQLTIVVNSNVEEVFVRADKDQLIRVFNNLIKNAKQSIPSDRDGRISVDIQLLGEKALITVADNGVGIEKSKLGKIFVPYFTTKSTGTGLGLAMVKQIIENHRGSIDFDTEEGVGTTFIITLPMAQ
ncbi:MAG: GHKL domain-containing protein [Crocinitomicaceae bacterium]|nr:GHKL domain-containing protein [Crocinitomicaceae bacterium]